MSISESFGEIRLQNESTRELEASSRETVTFTHQTAEWIPPERYAQHLPPGFTIRLDCCLGADGHRRFLPENGDWRSLVVQCFMAGMAIHTELGSLRQESATNLQIQFYASQWMKQRQDYIKRRFQYSRDIHLRKNSRVDDQERNTMSEISPLHPALRQIGLVREMAVVDHPNQNKLFHDGLYQIAQAIDSDLQTGMDTETILRNSILLHKSSLPELTQTKLEEVNQCLHLEMEKHFDLASDEFTGWLTSSGTNLPTVISRMTGRSGLSRSQANAGLFDLGWRGLIETATSINTTMRTIKNAISDLTENEQPIFDSLYLGQPGLNNVPILLLLDRHDFLTPAVVDIWNGRNIDEVLPAIRLLLFFYGSMTRHRRQADRTGKARSQSRNKDGRTSSQTLINQQVTGSFVTAEIQDDMIDALIIRCDQCNGQRLTLDFDYCELKMAVSISGCCNDCESNLPRQEVSLDRLKEIFAPVEEEEEDAE